VQSIKALVQETADLMSSQAAVKKVRLEVEFDVDQDLLKFDRLRV
jgi:hypothetical protein